MSNYPYMDSNSDRRYLCEEYAREQWGPVVQKAEEGKRHAIGQMKTLEAENAKLAKEAEAGRAFIKMMEAIKDNPGAQHFWEKTMAMLRLVE